jgi:hypothetical protein
MNQLALALEELHREPSLLDDLQSQVPGKPFKPKSQTLKRWLDESYKHYKLKLKENSLNYLLAPRIREIWLQLLIEAAEAGIEQTPITLLEQAAIEATLENLCKS